MDMEPVAAIGNGSVGVEEFLLLLQRRLLGGEFQEGIDLEQAFLTGEILDLIQHRRGVFPPAHAEGPLHRDTPQAVRPDGQDIHGKIRQIPEALFLFSPPAKALAGKVHAFPADTQPLPKPVHHADPLIGRFDRRHQNALIAPGHREGRRHRGVTAQTIGQQNTRFLCLLQRSHVLLSKIVSHSAASRFVKFSIYKYISYLVPRQYPLFRPVTFGVLSNFPFLNLCDSSYPFGKSKFFETSCALWTNLLCIWKGAVL